MGDFHSTGRWDWRPASGIDGVLTKPARVFTLVGGTSRDLAEVGLDRVSEADANARLMASAVDLMDALRELVNEAKQYMTDEATDEAIAKAEHALARASGEGGT